MNYETIISRITAEVTENTQGLITGTVMQNILTAIVNTVGRDSGFMGFATPETTPSITPDGKPFYFAVLGGDYSSFTESANALNAGFHLFYFEDSAWVHVDLLLAVENATIAAIEATNAANIATQNAITATENANTATDSANTATANANTATANAIAATSAATTATENTITATNAANTATANANTATSAAITATQDTISATNDAIAATENTITATNAANTATANANTATTNANTATQNAIAATNAANTATQNAINATDDANTATEYANTATHHADAATIAAQGAAELAANAAILYANLLQVDDVQPNLGIGAHFKLNAQILPASNIQNIIYVADGDVMKVDQISGNVTANAVGDGYVYVIPTTHTSIAKKLSFTVSPQGACMIDTAGGLLLLNDNGGWLTI
jgi:hypothetical protein